MDACKGMRHRQFGDRAAASCGARRQARALPQYPGRDPGQPGRGLRLPGRGDRRCGRIAIAGWKVGKIAGRLGRAGRRGSPGRADLRRHRVQRAGRAAGEFAVIAGGFAAVEAEFVFVLAPTRPPARLDWTVEEAAALVAEACTSASNSPAARCPTSTSSGRAVVVSDYGNNAGLMLGPADRRLAAARSMDDLRLRDLHRRRVGRHRPRQLDPRRPAGRAGVRAVALRAPWPAAARRSARCPPAPPPASTTSSPGRTRAWSSRRRLRGLSRSTCRAVALAAGRAA